MNHPNAFSLIRLIKTGIDAPFHTLRYILTRRLTSSLATASSATQSIISARVEIGALRENLVFRVRGTRLPPLSFIAVCRGCPRSRRPCINNTRPSDSSQSWPARFHSWLIPWRASNLRYCGVKWQCAIVAVTGDGFWSFRRDSFTLRRHRCQDIDGSRYDFIN